MASQNAAESFVIQSWDGKFLSRTFRWVRHKNSRRNGPGISRAWAHPLDELLKGGPWQKDATRVFPAAYDPVSDSTVVSGNSRMFTDFTSLRRAGA